MATLNGPTLLGLGSAIALFGLVALLLRLRARSGPAFLLALFAAAWGVQQVALRGAALVGASDLGRALVLVAPATALPMYLFLLHLAATYPTPLRVTRSRFWVPAIALPGVLLLAVAWWDVRAAVDPSAAPGQPVFGWGTLFFPFLAFLAAEVVMLARFAAGYLRAATPTARAQFQWGLVGLVPYLAYQQGNLVPTSAVFTANLAPREAAAFTAVMVAALGFVLAVAGWLAWRSGGRARLGWVAAAVLPAALGAWLAPGEVFGLFRILLVGALAYGVAKYQLFDLDLRLRQAARPFTAAVVGLAVAGVVAAAVGLGATGEVGGGVLINAAPDLLLLAALAGLVVGAPAGWAAGRVLEARFPYLPATREYLLRRKLEVYRAAMEAGASEAQGEALARDLGLRGPALRAAQAGRGAAGPGSDLAVGQRVGGRYRVERFLASGMYGGVLQAWDERLGERVVLKEYAGFGGPGAAEGFAREVKTLGALDHPNVLGVRDVFRAGEDMFVVLEHAPDGTLEARLGRAPVPEDEALALLRPVLEGLAAAHRRGIVHRDVKPANILFRGAVPKLADFGVAFDPVLDGALRAAQGQPGTLLWMAPEQAAGATPTPAVDVYAAGTLLYRLLAGRHPLGLDGLGEAAARRALARRAPALPLPGVGEATNAVLARALAKDPEARYPDAGAMLADLRRRRGGLRGRAAGEPARAGRAYGAA